MSTKSWKGNRKKKVTVFSSLNIFHIFMCFLFLDTFSTFSLTCHHLLFSHAFLVFPKYTNVNAKIYAYWYTQSYKHIHKGQSLIIDFLLLLLVLHFSSFSYLLFSFFLFEHFVFILVHHFSQSLFISSFSFFYFHSLFNKLVGFINDPKCLILDVTITE